MMFRRIFLFLVTNLLIMVTLSFIIHFFGLDQFAYRSSGLQTGPLLMFCLVWGMGGSFISLLLSKFMAKWMMGVKVIDPKTAQGAEADLLQVVYRLAQSAHISGKPEVGIYDSEEVNAFATGPTQNSALVAVSSGLLRRMNREEIEGVLGHEIAHIANGDMVTMTLIQGVVNAFVMFLARVIAFAATQNSREENKYMVRMVITFALEIFFSIFASILVAYFSRLREFRADAGGARFAGRQKMIAALTALRGTTELISKENQSMATLKISGRKGFLSFFSTHPSLEERIARLQSMA